jgi:hypothetical protein
MYEEFMRTKGEKTADRYHDWIFPKLLLLKKILVADWGKHYELGKDLIKPLLEFT